MALTEILAKMSPQWREQEREELLLEHHMDIKVGSRNWQEKEIAEPWHKSLHGIHQDWHAWAREEAMEPWHKHAKEHRTDSKNLFKKAGLIK